MLALAGMEGADDKSRAGHVVGVQTGWHLQVSRALGWCAFWEKVKLSMGLRFRLRVSLALGESISPETVRVSIYAPKD